MELFRAIKGCNKYKFSVVECSGGMRITSQGKFLDLCRYTLCLILPGLIGSWQKSMSRWAIWCNIPTQVCQQIPLPVFNIFQHFPINYADVSSF